MKKIIYPPSKEIEDALHETIKYKYPEFSREPSIEYNKTSTGVRHSATVTFYTLNNKFEARFDYSEVNNSQSLGPEYCWHCTNDWKD